MERRNLKSQGWIGYAFLSPLIVFYSIFLCIPLVFSFYLSFTEWSGFDLSDIKWVGLKNYRELFSEHSPFFHPIMTNTFTYAVCSVALSFTGALAISYMITRLKYEGFWRTLYFLPTVTTIVAIGNVWLYMYNPTTGLISGILSSLNLKPIAFLENPHTALSSIIVVGGWLGIGSAVLILTAGLKAIPEDYYEAAMLEGAGVFAIYKGITLPLLKPSILFVLITSFIGGLQSFTLVMVMTKNATNATNVAGLEMYYQAFSFSNWGIASAMAFVLFIFVFIVTMLQLVIFRQGGVESY